MKILRFSVMLLCAFSVRSATSSAQESNKHEKGHQESINKPFEDPNLDPKTFVKRFESDSREVYAKRLEIVKACDVGPGMAVADIGAGTGVFSLLFAEKVGEKGKVYAIDIAPAFLKYIDEAAQKKGVTRVVKTLKGGQNTTNLPPNSVDLVFICDAYHHFEKPEEMLRSIQGALRPGGRVVLVEFDKRPDATEFIKNHARAEKEVYFKEFEAAGFTRIATDNAPTLEENFFAQFKTADAKSKQ